ncbi:MAG: flagellar basal body-associated FliL family protein [Clostridia bacterium]|nr:flagellar basal body-associated FliL family protein [Clostridia bacterium]
MKKKIIVIVLAAVLFLGAGAAAYFFYFKDKIAGKNETPEEVSENYEYAVESSFVTNVKDSSKLFKTTIVLVADEKGMEEFFKAEQNTVRDVILFVLRELTEEDIESEDIQDHLRVSIPAALNKALGTDSIVSVYFTDFVMQ